MHGKTHAAVGIISGGLYSALACDVEQDHDILLHALAGIAGGYVGAKLPDLLEPPTSSWHRDVVHSLTAGVGTVACAPAWLTQLEGRAQEQIMQHQLIMMHAGSPQERNSAELGLLFWKLLIPFLRGVLAGYLSHLALDATTPRSLPWLCRGDSLTTFQAINS